ncbi:PorT family protein [Flavobacterium aquariorum]|uniref:PorT family protein n=1 Tax=Flavobacterium aquariorum TaxID=2217670 RepID=A0A2W7UCK8_9FLAO|nr:porin family protein [Flavobacterium aquariorum]PZX92907.1 PorT family protein [Flavobacterium aquariorum]
MKKILLSAIAVLAFGFTNAQGVKFGVKAALNVATLTGDVEDASSLVGFQVGGFAEIKVSEKFAVQPELMFSTQGASFDGFDSKLNYLNIPVMAKFYVAKSFSLEAGPQIGFLLSAKEDGEDFKDFASSTDFGLNLGAGYDFTENLSAGLRYNIGLSNVSDFPGDSSSIKNGVFSVSLAYKF